MIKNMNIDKAKKYAEGKVADALSQVVADAYLAGYNAGYQDGIDKVAKDSVSEETEFVDLGLPSGTIWSSDYVKTDNGNVVYVTKENCVDHDIPTFEQWKELVDECKWKQMSEKNWTESGFYHWHEWAICLGPNGNKITFEKTGIYETTDSRTRTSEILFWLNNKEYFHRNCASITLNDLNVDSENVFSGYKLPIRPVKTIG